MYRPTIPEMRKRLHLSQEDVAEKSGISRKYLSDIEIGKKSPTVRILSLICDAMGVSIYDIDLNFYAN